MENPEKMWENFESEWQMGDAVDTGALYYVTMFLREILVELRGHRPVELEPITIESYESRYPLMAGGLSRAMVRRFDEEVQRRMAELHAPLRDTETAHGNRLDLVKHTAIEELNVAPQVAEYARRILMGCRPEPDRGVMDLLWDYAGVEVPEGYTLVAKGLVALKDLTEWAIKEEGVHPAAAELARRILAGEGPTITVYYRVRSLTHEDGPPQTGLLSELKVVGLELQTVMVVDADVDLEQGDLGEEHKNV